MEAFRILPCSVHAESGNTSIGDVLIDGACDRSEVDVNSALCAVHVDSVLQILGNLNHVVLRSEILHIGEVDSSLSLIETVLRITGDLGALVTVHQLLRRGLQRRQLNLRNLVGRSAEGELSTFKVNVVGVHSQIQRTGITLFVVDDGLTGSELINILLKCGEVALNQIPLTGIDNRLLVVIGVGISCRELNTINSNTIVGSEHAAIDTESTSVDVTENGVVGSLNLNIGNQLLQTTVEVVEFLLYISQLVLQLLDVFLHSLVSFLQSLGQVLKVLDILSIGNGLVEGLVSLGLSSFSSSLCLVGSGLCIGCSSLGSSSISNTLSGISLSLVGSGLSIVSSSLGIVGQQLEGLEGLCLKYRFNPQCLHIVNLFLGVIVAQSSLLQEIAHIGNSRNIRLQSILREVEHTTVTQTVALHVLVDNRGQSLVDDVVVVLNSVGNVGVTSCATTNLGGINAPRTVSVLDNDTCVTQSLQLIVQQLTSIGAGSRQTVVAHVLNLLLQCLLQHTQFFLLLSIVVTFVVLTGHERT